MIPQIDCIIGCYVGWLWDWWLHDMYLRYIHIHHTTPLCPIKHHRSRVIIYIKPYQNAQIIGCKNISDRYHRRTIYGYIQSTPHYINPRPDVKSWPCWGIIPISTLLVKFHKIHIPPPMISWYIYIYTRPLTPGKPQVRARRPVGPARGPVRPVSPWACRARIVSQGPGPVGL